jgi:hypothetical protein
MSLSLSATVMVDDKQELQFCYNQCSTFVYTTFKCLPGWEIDRSKFKNYYSTTSSYCMYGCCRAAYMSYECCRQSVNYPTYKPSSSSSYPIQTLPTTRLPTAKPTRSSIPTVSTVSQSQSSILKCQLSCIIGVTTSAIVVLILHW